MTTSAIRGMGIGLKASKSRMAKGRRDACLEKTVTWMNSRIALCPYASKGPCNANVRHEQMFMAAERYAWLQRTVDERRLIALQKLFNPAHDVSFLLCLGIRKIGVGVRGWQNAIVSMDESHDVLLYFPPQAPCFSLDLRSG